MTATEARELNRQIKYLNKRIKNRKDESQEELIKLGPEFIRLHNLDPNFKYMNRQSILMMLSINRTYKFIPFNNFGTSIEI
jgi:hypothetical protein